MVSDVVEEVADIALQGRIVQGNAELALRVVRRDQYPQVLLGKKVHRESAVSAEPARCGRERWSGDRALEALRGGAQVTVVQQCLDACLALIPALAALDREHAQALALAGADAAGVLETAQAIELSCCRRSRLYRLNVMVSEGVLAGGELDAALAAYRRIAHAEITLLLGFHEREHLQTFIDSAELEQPVGQRAIRRHFVAEESAIEAPIFADEMTALALDLADRLLAEENRERRLFLLVQHRCELKVGLPERLGHAGALGGCNRAHCVAQCRGVVAARLREPALIVVDQRAQRGCRVASALEAARALGTIVRGRGRGDLGLAELIQNAQDGRVRFRQPAA